MANQKLEKKIGSSWEKINSEVQNGVNPHAYRLGYLDGYKQSVYSPEVALLIDAVNACIKFHSDKPTGFVEGHTLGGTPSFLSMKSAIKKLEDLTKT